MQVYIAYPNILIGPLAEIETSINYRYSKMNVRTSSKVRAAVPGIVHSAITSTRPLNWLVRPLKSIGEACVVIIVDVTKNILFFWDTEFQRSVGLYKGVVVRARKIA